MGEEGFMDGFNGALFLDDGNKQVEWTGLTEAVFDEESLAPPTEDRDSLIFEIPRTEEISFSLKCAHFQLPKEWEKGIKKWKKGIKKRQNWIMRANRYRKRLRERIRRAKLKGEEWIGIGRMNYIMPKITAE